MIRVLVMNLTSNDCRGQPMNGPLMLPMMSMDHLTHCWLDHFACRLASVSLGQLHVV
jgi:hypothetical protein